MVNFTGSEHVGRRIGELAGRHCKCVPPPAPGSRSRRARAQADAPLPQAGATRARRQGSSDRPRDGRRRRRRARREQSRLSGAHPDVPSLLTTSRVPARSSSARTCTADRRAWCACRSSFCVLATLADALATSTTRRRRSARSSSTPSTTPSSARSGLRMPRWLRPSPAGWSSRPRTACARCASSWPTRSRRCGIPSPLPPFFRTPRLLTSASDVPAT